MLASQCLIIEKNRLLYTIWDLMPCWLIKIGYIILLIFNLLFATLPSHILLIMQD